jgi:alcohol dehydrogenase class IV
LARIIDSGTTGDSDEAAAQKFIGRIEVLCKTCEVPTLKEYGIEKQAYMSVIDKMAEDAIASGSPGNTRKEVTKEDCIALYKKLYTE